MGYSLAAGHLASLEFCHYFVPTTTNICAMLKDDANDRRRDWSGDGTFRHFWPGFLPQNKNTDFFLFSF
jgi:hypothetical protein